jgi:hypothetical protein
LTPAAGPPLVDSQAALQVDAPPSTPLDEPAAGPDVTSDVAPMPAAPRRPDLTRGDVFLTRERPTWWRIERQPPTLPLPANVRSWSQEGDAEWTYPAKG